MLPAKLIINLDGLAPTLQAKIVDLIKETLWKEITDIDEMFPESGLMQDYKTATEKELHSIRSQMIF